MIKSRRRSLVDHVAHLRDMKNAYRVLLETIKGRDN
jgi:hypothetical protein